MNDSKQKDELSVNIINQTKSNNAPPYLDKKDASLASTSISTEISEDKNNLRKGPLLSPSEPGSKKKNPLKKPPPVVVSLAEFLDRLVVNEGKILAQDKKVFDTLNSDLTEEHEVRLEKLFLEKDTDLKYCQVLSDFLVEGSRDSSTRIKTLDFIERVVSGYSLFKNIGTNSVLQGWLQGSSDRSDKLAFFEGQFRSLKSNDYEDVDKNFTEDQVTTLLCISAVWLYFKKQSDFFTLTRYLSRSAFNTGGQSSSLIENQAFAFATSMISSAKKKQFSYFLQVVSDAELRLTQQLHAKSAESINKTSKIMSLTSLNSKSIEENDLLKAEVKSLSSKIQDLEVDVKSHHEKARHRNTHHQDSKDGLRIKLENVLEGELKDVLEKAKKAHYKEKYNVVEYQINDALRILSKELKRMESYD
jgi:hypothetical protein